MYLQKDFGFAQLIIGILQDLFADFACCHWTVFLVRRHDAVDEKPVAINKVRIRVSYGITSTTDPYGFHHARIAQLTHDQLTIKVLIGK